MLTQTLCRRILSVQKTGATRIGSCSGPEFAIRVFEDNAAECQCWLNGLTILLQAKTSTTRRLCLIALIIHMIRRVHKPSRGWSPTFFRRRRQCLHPSRDRTIFVFFSRGGGGSYIAASGPRTRQTDKAFRSKAVQYQLGICSPSVAEELKMNSIEWVLEHVKRPFLNGEP